MADSLKLERLDVDAIVLKAKEMSRQNFGCSTPPHAQRGLSHQRLQSPKYSRSRVFLALIGGSTPISTRGKPFSAETAPSYQSMISNI